MVDSVKVVDENYVQRIHSNPSSGKLHKGHSITAASASIPSKYQTIVIDNSEKQGFHSRARRFQYESGSSDNPGPGNYVGHVTIDTSSPSYSKKGTGGFASKDRRLLKHSATCSPGSAAYAVPSMISTRKDFNKAGSTSTFHRPIAQNVEEKAASMPAPNQYDVLKARNLQGRSNNVRADAAFKSQSKREVIRFGDAKTKPAPWQYHIKEELVKDSIKVPVSCFKSKTRRQMQPDSQPVPGPGTYKPYEELEPVSKIVFPRKHYLCISAPAMPLPTTPPPPGPGSYELVNYKGPHKHFMSGAAFVSSTSRWTGDTRVTGPLEPGPAHYHPREAGKQSFIYNSVGRWI